MRSRTLALAAAGAALLATTLPATARGAAVPGAGGPASGVPVAGAPASAHEGSIGAAELLAKVTGCDQISHGKYRTDADAPATVPVCGKNGAVFWKADLDIDCDGRRGTVCNKKTDPWFQPDTRFHQSDGEPLDAAKLPYVVVPSPGPVWDYRASGIEGGGVAAVIHGDKVAYAVVGDTGSGGTIGEASYATAKALGLDPSPRSGGAESDVTYILFKGAGADPIEDHEAAVALGDTLAHRFLADN
ncbi:glycoside hydrolase family 75 protein [Streptomyces sp. NBC_00083]|uniref:glycoside hydrolase family 75 protein n=1 Tax=Streptomyces sp. NBC_00083 TaxID=2975647 RepID=UPI00224DE7C2|nr:glycoside hydrolase family 75 protein [Streptomyces sp. NBC_00083]MCX5386511.1 glycoside hydrolase family 75 protein [Streptomyces sp. NBC_00083]